MKSLVILASVIFLTACASVYSTKNTASNRGLVYYMPKQDIVISIVNTNGKLTQATATATVAYADRTTPYLLEYQRHPLAKNSLDVQISAAGLLTNSESGQIGDAVTALGALGSIAGFVRGFGFGIQSDSTGIVKAKDLSGECSVDGTHTFIVSVPALPGAATEVCDGKVRYSIEPMGWVRDASGGEVGHAGMEKQPEKQSIPGVFYRMNLPYRVKISMDGGFHAETVVLSPSESRDYFLPIARSFFANNDSKITLMNGAGVPSKYVQDTEGEVTALLKLPAALIAPYFAAVGQVFSGNSSNASAEKSARENSISAQLARLKYEACLKAIEAKDSVMIVNLSCGSN